MSECFDLHLLQGLQRLICCISYNQVSEDMYDVRRKSWIVEEKEDAENEPEKVAKFIYF